MRRVIVGAALLCLFAVPAQGSARAGASADEVRSLAFPRSVPTRPSTERARLETLWIFDADFEDLVGDNAGWTTEDRSGTLAIENYWHKDTIRINGFTHLGDSTWWCGKYDPCWRQSRGYGNDWYQVLSREFPEVATLTEPGDVLVLEYDQRVAMEKDYDYGYTDVSADGGETWTTVWLVDNPGFAGTPGMSQDWSSTNPSTPGHVQIDLSDYAGQEISIRFRFESDGAYSSQDQWNNPPFNSCLDGAWQLDNIELLAATPEPITIFIDDCESPGDNGWWHEDTPARGQTGVVWWRGLFGTDIWTNRSFTCDDRQGWMYAAVDPMTSRMVDYEFAWLLSPPIDISSADKLVGQWDFWLDMPRDSEDIFNIAIRAGDDLDCVDWWDPYGSPGWWYGDPGWRTRDDDWDAFAGNDWLQILWIVLNDDPPVPPAMHWGGVFLNWQRVGIPSGDSGTEWEIDHWNSFNDWFVEEIADALLDTMYVNVKDDDGITAVTLVASNDEGQTWDSYYCRREDQYSQWWYAPPPVNQMTQGREIRFYFEAEDLIGNTAVYPADAPEEYLEMSILPIHGSVSDPGILLVDKHGRPVPGEQRDYSTLSEDYFREALDILGYEYDVYDVDVPSGAILSDGPDTCGMKYYDTQIWFTNRFDHYTILRSDQRNLIDWLSEASGGAERNLFLTGNDIGYELVETGDETLGFYGDWLATEYVSDSAGEVTIDSLLGLRDFAGGFDFMTYDDRQCVLRGGCPDLEGFDVIQPSPGLPGAEVVAEYVKLDLTTRPAGVAYTDTSGYQTVTLGFGIEFMSDMLLPNGHYASGASDRVDLIANVMEYFGATPTGPATGTEGGEVLVTRLGPARPNPFNPRTAFEYSLAGRSQVTIRVFDLAGRVVRTLVARERGPGEHTIIWDGMTDSGERASSGVYFVRMEGTGDAGSFSETGKAVMLR